MSEASTRSRSEFSKRLSPPSLFFGDLAFILGHLPSYIGVLIAKRVDFAFSERLRLVTTAVNQCVICARLHVELGQLAGIDQGEIRALLNNDLGGRDPEDREVTALLYAQHYAETGRAPLPEMTRRLHEFYGEETTRDIMLVIRLINFFNLAGNTLEAFMLRLRGGVVPGKVFPQFLVALVSAPVALPFFAYMAYKGNRFTFSDERAQATAGNGK
jgi:AhpD family alkylhydroperoxidase